MLIGIIRGCFWKTKSPSVQPSSWTCRDNKKWDCISHRSHYNSQLSRKQNSWTWHCKIDVGRGFYFMSSPSVQSTKRILMLYHPPSFNDALWFSTCTPIFDFGAPKDLGLPMWIILHYMPLEYCPIQVVVAIQIDVVLGYDASNASR